MSLADLIKTLKPRPIWTPRPELLLALNVPKPLHGVAPRVVLGRAWWDKERHAAYASTDFHCAACGVHKMAALFHRWLEGHEVYRINWGLGRATYVETVPLCHACHCFIHDGRLQALLDKGKLTRERFDAVMAHGKRVLDDAGLVKRSPQIGVKFARWERWRLVVDGREFPPLHRTEADWIKHFGGADAAAGQEE